MSSLSRKTVALAAGAAIVVVGGATAGIVIATQSGGHPAAASAQAKAHVIAAPPLHLESITPAPGSQDADGAADITVTYNQPVPATVPLPSLSPAIAGSWERTGDTMVFTPSTGFPAATHVTVKAAATTGTTVRSVSSSFTTGDYSTLRLQELLAQLGYLPLTWTPAATPRSYQGASAPETAVVPSGSVAAQLAAAYSPPAGTFAWEPGYPAQLHSFWTQGQANTLDQGAITGFEGDHGLPTDGVAGPKVWQALLTAAAANQRNTQGYSYAIASKASPETLTIWHNGKQVFSSLANTGIAAAPTADGTFPVYEKLPFQIMQGTNPDGSTYADPVEWVSYFNGGDAVHYFPRASFGFPQSLGCVELPYSAAQEAYPYLPYGTLVTVE